ncbi:MAG: YggT family protein [Solirubrobacterales bacterium]|nr:YggT family protein [Solirubrobacterales bacterium]
MTLLLAITRQDWADYASALFMVFIILIFINILLSWFSSIPYNRTLYALIDFVKQTTDPYLNLFRRFLPPIGGGGLAIDISPILAIIVLFIVRAVVVGVIEPD